MKISVIIPVYNKIRYLRTVLQQVREQSFSDFECLLVDDGSTDGSGAVCDEFAAADSRFCVYHIPNGGVSHARNVGLDAAKGEYITFIDADDEIERNYLQHLYECIENSGADISISGLRKFWDDKKMGVDVRHPFLTGAHSLEECLDRFAKVQKNTGLFGYCVAKIFNRSYCAEIRFDEDLRLAEDFDFFLKLYENARTIWLDDACLYYYRQDAENSSMIVDDAQIDYMAQLTINLRYRHFLQKKMAYQGENKAIVDVRLANYLYFSAFHCPKQKMQNRFNLLAEIQKRESIRCITGNCLQRLVLLLLRTGNCNAAAAIILGYRSIKKIVRR